MSSITEGTPYVPYFPLDGLRPPTDVANVTPRRPRR
jgi:hypothetical protein